MVKDVPTTKNFSSTATCQQLSIQGVTKSAGGKSPTYAIDNSYDTYWSNNRLGSWIKIDFGSSKILCSINIAWFKGNLRIYNFDVLVSNDGMPLLRNSQVRVVVEQQTHLRHTIYPQIPWEDMLRLW